MSLKDRLNSQPKTIDNDLVKEKLQESIKNIEKKQIQPEGLGILETYFLDNTLNSVYVSGAKNVYIEKRGVVHKSTTTFRDNIQLINIIKKNALDSNIKYDENLPYIKFNHKKGVNVSAILPPLASVPVIFIKNYCDENANLKFLQENQAVSKELAMILETFASMKLNILIAGNPQSLKTTALSAIAKLVPITNRGVAIDFKNEITIDSDNFVTYDFLSLKDNEIRNEIFDSIFNSNPDKVIVNDCDEELFYEIIRHLSSGFKGLVTSLNASNTAEAVDNIAKIILTHNPKMHFEEAQRCVYGLFDIIIFVNKNENGFRSISKISETDFQEAKINDIFYLNANNEHSSSGFVPKFYTLSNSLSINPNVFDENYKHTYSKPAAVDFQPTGNLIKKIKENASSENIVQTDTVKEQDVQENNSVNNFESISKSLSSEEMLKRAQEKFEELRRNSNRWENINEEHTENIADIENSDNSENNSNG